jgi:predicted nucleic-acid-binding Zn-ribbon protein
MTGDGKSEIMLVHPDTMTIQWMTSESGYTTVYSRTIGSQRSIVL